MFWTKSNYDYLYNSEKQLFRNDKTTIFGFSNENNYNLELAYKLGTYRTNYSLVLFENSKMNASKFIFINFDGLSNLLYAYSWIINTPQKWLHQVAYNFKTKSYRYLLDDLMWIIFAIIMIFIALIVGIYGSLISLVLHPINTIFVLPCGIWLLLKTTFVGIIQLIFGLYDVISSMPFALKLLIRIIFNLITGADTGDI